MRVSSFKDSSFKDKVIWITGASSGIGESLTYAFASQGANLILSSRNKAALQRVKDNCNGNRNKIHILPLDLSKLHTLNTRAKHALKIFGKIDFMIHNAGVALKDLAMNTDIEIDKKIMDINYFSTVVLTKNILRSMEKQKSGHIVVISSVSGKFGVPKSSSYAASKHALHGFFESLRAEIAKDNIKITMVVPGFVRTNITINALKGDGAKYGKMMPIQDKGMTPSKCARKIVEAMSKNKEEVLIGGPEILGVYCKRLSPVLLSKIIRSHPVKKYNAVKRFFNFKKFLFKYEY
jgi:dehydrogenase/reductase SDR family protein 7B